MNIEITATKTGTTVLLVGDLDTAAAQALDVRLEALLPSLKGTLTVDLGALSYLNSTGIRSFIRLDKALKAHEKRFSFVNANPRILRIFQYCGMDGYFTFEPAPTLAKGA